MYNILLNGKKKCVVFIMAMFILMGINTITAFAAANIEIKSENATAEQEIKVNVSVNSDQNIGTFDLRITYDTTMLEYISGADNGGSGVLQVLNSELTQSNTVTKELVFKALDEGEAAVTVQLASSSVLDMNANPMEVVGGQGIVKIGTATDSSADNTLSSLNVVAVKKDGTNVPVNITPNFSKEVTDYSLNVGNDTKKLSIAVTTSEASATTQITGNKLSKGDNMTVITVTASNGEVKEYKIYTKKGDDASSEQVAEDNPTSNVEALPLPEDLSTKKDGKTGKFIVQNFEGITVPTGYVPQGYKYGENQVAVVSNGSVVLFLLADDENGANAAWFVYNSEKDIFALYNVLNINGREYVLLSGDKNAKIPDGYKESVVKINDIDATVWSNGNDAGVVLIYASCDAAFPELYYYDAKDTTVMKYFNQNSVEKNPQDEYKSKYQKIKTEYDDSKIVLIEIIAGFSVFCVILGVMCIVFALKAKNGNQENDFDEEQEQNDSEEKTEEKTLQLDMAIQANEVKTETLANDVNSIMEEDELVDTMNMVPVQMSDNVEDNVSNNVVEEAEVVEPQIQAENNVEEVITVADEKQDEKSDIDIVFVDLEEDNN